MEPYEIFRTIDLDSNQQVLMDSIFLKAQEFGNMIKMYSAASREQSLALTKLEEVVFWANSAIARHHGSK